jgi:hypothetical protein
VYIFRSFQVLWRDELQQDAAQTREEGVQRSEKSLNEPTKVKIAYSYNIFLDLSQRTRGKEKQWWKLIVVYLRPGKELRTKRVVRYL